MLRARIVLTFSATALAAGCGSGETGSTETETVVAAFYPVAYAVERIAPQVEVENLTPAGAEPHDLELSPREVERIREADSVLYFGQGFMPALEAAVEGVGGAVDLLAGEPLRSRTDGHDPDLDPHVWLDPRRYAGIVRRIAGALGAPTAADELVGELEQLDGEFRRGLARCERRELVTSHAAFGYLADAYDLQQVPLTGLTPEAEPSARALERLVSDVKASNATTVFFEPLVSPKLAETVAREAAVKTEALNPLEGLTEDELDAGADYLSVMRENLSVLREALGCT